MSGNVVVSATALATLEGTRRERDRNQRAASVMSSVTATTPAATDAGTLERPVIHEQLTLDEMEAIVRRIGDVAGPHREGSDTICESRDQRGEMITVVIGEWDAGRFMAMTGFDIDDDKTTASTFASNSWNISDEGFGTFSYTSPKHRAVSTSRSHRRWQSRAA